MRFSKLRYWFVVGFVFSAGSAVAADECQIWDDSQGVSHAKAANDEGAIRCLGYLHGRDRAWQMDYLRRTVQGRKAEILGKSAIKGDFVMRVLGLSERGQGLFEKMSAEDQKWYKLYAVGVNAGFTEALKLGSYEFERFGYQPEPWRAEDSIGVVLLQAFDQTRKTFESDLEESSWKTRFGTQASSLFAQEGLPWDTSVMKSSEIGRGRVASADVRELESRAGIGVSSEAAGKFFESAFGHPSMDGGGSNNWVVASKLSQTGRAWMANDPHLSLKHPPFWYHSHIQGDRLDVIGASLPGVPVIVSGTNRFASWGLTNAYMDVADAYFVPENEIRPQPSVRPWIWVKVWKFQVPFFFKTYQRTERGWPVLPLPAPAGKSVVLRWSGFDLEPKDFRGLRDFMSARSADEVDQALAAVGVPSWNFVFADVYGKIGFRTVGKIPRRTEAPGFGAQELSLSNVPAWDWLSSEEMPHLLSPARGWIATANNRQWPGDARFHAGRGYTEGFRATRIEELLVQTPKHSLESHRAIQCDSQAVDARYLLPLLMKQLKDLSLKEKRVAQVLEAWDYSTGVDCRACGVYRYWVDEVMDTLVLDEASLYRMLEMGAKAPDPKLSMIVQGAFRETLERLYVDKTGLPPIWGDLHRNVFEHLAGRDWFFGESEALPTPGDKHSVNPGNSKWNTRYFDHNAGASQRVVVEMTSPPTMHAILPGSNADTARRGLDEKGSIWRRWSACELEKRNFPVDWAKVPAQKIVL